MSLVNCYTCILCAVLLLLDAVFSCSYVCTTLSMQCAIHKFALLNLSLW